VDLIWSVVSSSGDSALECDRECVQGWFRALCLSNTSRLRRGQGCLTSAKDLRGISVSGQIDSAGSHRHSRLALAGGSAYEIGQ
jgi:hypothetical protein